MIKIAVIGAGNWGKNLVRNFHRLGNLYAVCDESQDILKSIKQEYPGIVVTNNYRDMLNDPHVDGVVIATQAEHHFSVAKEAILKDKHVLIEKPMTTTVKDSEELVELSIKKSHLTVMVGHLMLYHPAVREIKTLIDNNSLGRVFYLYSTRVNLGRVRSVENVIWSLAVHDVSVFVYLIKSEIKHLDAQGCSFLQKGIEDIAFLNLYFENGIMGHIHVGWLDPLKIRSMTILGENKMAVFNDTSAEEQLKIYDKGISKFPDSSDYTRDILQPRYGDIIIPYIKMKEPLYSECSHFIECITERKKPISDIMQGLEVVKILSAANKSIEKSMRIDI